MKTCNEQITHKNAINTKMTKFYTGFFFLIGQIRRYLCHRNEKKINQKFVLLKVASDKKFGQHFP